MKNILLYSLLFLSLYSFSQEQIGDTLFIEYDNSLLTKYTQPIDKYNYYLIKGTGNKEELVYLMEYEIYRNLEPKNVQCLKKVLKKSNAYYKNNKLHDSKLANYLGKYVIFLIKENKYIKVQAVLEIE